MKNKIILPTLLFILILIFSFFLFSSRGNDNDINNANSESELILFYGDSCPHCEIVDEFIEENKIYDKISYAHKEVYNNQENARELSQKAEVCGLNTNLIGVPFLFDGENCYLGDKDIINYFKDTIKF